MDISLFITLFAATIPVFLILDMIWLGLIAKNFYQKELSKLLRKRENGTLKPMWSAAVIFYILFVAGIIYFATGKAIESGSYSTSLFAGAAFGLVSYATYDLTNLATIRDFPLKIVVIDLAWGMSISAVVATWAFQVSVWL